MNSSKKNWFRIVKMIAYVLVVVGVTYTVWNGVSQISQSDLSISNFRWFWLVPASLFYFGSMSLCWMYWHMVLKAMGQKPSLARSFCAFVLGQLGKYFPGKALVVFLRTNHVSGPDVQPAVAATSVFLETLTYMAVGAGVASLIMVTLIDVGPWLIVIGIGAIIAAGLPIVPPVFRFIIRTLRIDRLSPKIGAAVENLDLRISLYAWLILPFSWLLVGFSLWSSIQLIGVDVSLQEVPRLTACAGLAIVVGFLSMMPGGLGVREFVLITILQPLDPAFDASTTLVIAVVLRLVWLMTEAALTIILNGLGLARRVKQPTSSSPPDDPTNSNHDQANSDQ